MEERYEVGFVGSRSPVNGHPEAVMVRAYLPSGRLESVDPYRPDVDQGACVFEYEEDALAWASQHYSR
jgi:hypothetical protein